MEQEYEITQDQGDHDGPGAVDEDPTNDQGAPNEEDQGAPNADYTAAPIPTGAATLETVAEEPAEDQGATGRKAQQFVREKYDLRPRKGGRPDRFAAAMDAPHNSKSYDSPTQLLQSETYTLLQTEVDVEQKKKVVFGRMFAQMTARAGIREFGKAAEDALMAEFAQLDDLAVFEAVRAEGLSNQQRKGALWAINLINKKRDGRLKGRTVADGRA